ncbi:mucin-22-like isoform X2 [Corticium candelabrum]|uniref:mucin-22-like isoform X2 n=1 Tax=Corticium candelabrum TaxID=121492 RepID=UPI002E267F88|nr:mucin-22-like isoform X2 [Corticium candelabrum]
MSSTAANALVFLVVLTLHTLSEVSSCSSGWTLSGSSCYRRFNTKKTWDNAEADCVKRGGHLVSIGSALENTLVYDIEGSNNSKIVWIGINKDRSSKFWSDGTDISYTHWDINPRRRRQRPLDDKDCSRMFTNSWWHYQDCTNVYYYVCETLVPTTNPPTTIVQMSTAQSTTVAATTDRSTTRNPTTSASITTQSTSAPTTVSLSTTAEGSTQLPTTISTSVSVATRSTSMPTTVSRPNTVEVSTQLPTTTSTLASSRKATKATTRMSRTTTTGASDALSAPISSTPLLTVLPRRSTEAMVTERKFTSQIHTTQISRVSNSIQSTSATTPETTTQQTEANKARSSSSNTTMYAAVGAAIVVIVLIVSAISVFLFWRRREGKSGFKTIQSQEHVADKSYANGIVVNSTISGVFFTKSGWADDLELTATSSNRRHGKRNASNTKNVKTSDDMQLNQLYSTRNPITEDFSTAASHKDSRSDKINILYQSADQLERPTARESENVIYNM